MSVPKCWFRHHMNECEDSDRQGVQITDSSRAEVSTILLLSRDSKCGLINRLWRAALSRLPKHHVSLHWEHFEVRHRKLTPALHALLWKSTSTQMGHFFMNETVLGILNFSIHQLVSVSIHGSSHDSCSAALTQTSEETRSTRPRRQAGKSNTTCQLLLSVKHLQASLAAGTSHWLAFPLISEPPPSTSHTFPSFSAAHHKFNTSCRKQDFECLHQKMPKFSWRRSEQLNS